MEKVLVYGDSKWTQNIAKHPHLSKKLLKL